jgi:hypothetical protein
MYKHAYQVLTALTLVAWLIVPVTRAQSIMVTADIPFSFVVGNKPLQSGEYHVKQLPHGVMLVQGKATGASAMVLSTGIQAGKISDVGKLVFNRYGDQYFLAKIWTPSNNLGRELPKSRLEREVAQRLSNGGTTVVATKK